MTDLEDVRRRAEGLRTRSFDEQRAGHQKAISQLEDMNRDLDAIDGHLTRLGVYGKPRTTYTEGKQHRDAKGRFASVGGGALAAAGFGAAGAGGLAGSLVHGEISHWDQQTGRDMTDFIVAARKGEKATADQKVKHMAQWDRLRPGLVRDRNKYGAIVAGGAVVGGAGLYLHSRANRHPVAKSFGHRVGQKLDSLHITPEQARNAGVMGQIGAGGGVVAGAAIGAGIGAAAKHPAAGAGIGGAIGGALGGAAGAGAGLYAGRPTNAKRRKKALVGTAPTTLSKAFDGKKRGAVIGAGVGLAGGEVIRHGARSAAQNLRTEAGLTDHLADYKRAQANARMMDGTADFHAGLKGRAAMVGGGAAIGALAVRHHQRKIAGQVEAPISKGALEPTLALGRKAATSRKLARAYAGFAQQAAKDPETAHRTNTYWQTAASYGRQARDDSASFKNAAANYRGGSIAKMDDDTKTKLARGGLIGAQLADVAAIKSAYHETTTATKTGTGIGSALSYGAKKAALPIVAGGLVASIGAERVMHSQQKKLNAANTASLKPRKAKIAGPTNP